MVLGRCIMGFYIPMCKKKATLVSDPFIVASDCFALLTVTNQISTIHPNFDM